MSPAIEKLKRRGEVMKGKESFTFPGAKQVSRGGVTCSSGGTISNVTVRCGLCHTVAGLFMAVTSLIHKF